MASPNQLRVEINVAAMEQAFTKGFQEGVRVSSEYFKRIFARIMEVTTYEDLVRILEEMQSESEGLVPGGPDSDQPSESEESHES